MQSLAKDAGDRMKTSLEDDLNTSAGTGSNFRNGTQVQLCS